MRHDKQLYGEITCGCGYANRSEPGRCPTDPRWTVALTLEFLNHWEAVWIVVAHPSLPLTNHDAERALRWVIARRLSQGTRTEQGSRAFALLARVIDACRRRNLLPWFYWAKVIAERRKGDPAPRLPAAA